MRSLKDRLAPLAAVLLIAALAAGCHRRLAPDPPDDDPNGDTTPEPAGPGESGHANYFRNATSIPAKLGAKIGGPVRVLELTVFPEYVVTEVQDPRKHGNVDGYTLRDGVVGDGEPVHLMGTMKSARDVDAAVQDLGAVNFGVLPRMVKETKHRLRIEEGRVTHAFLDARRVFHKEVTWRVYMSSPRKDGSVEFDLHGRVVKVYE